jgi:hypothetical protein
MRIVLLTAMLVALSAASATAQQQAAKVRLSGTSPIQVTGSGFTASERVTVRVTQPGHASLAKSVLATAAGRFVARFPRHNLDQCHGYAIAATGSSGSRATWRDLIPPPCGIDPSP